MIYPASAYLNLFFLFLGAALGSLACIIVGNVTKRKYFKFRLSLTFLLFAAALVFVVLYILETGLSAEAGKTILSALSAHGVVLFLYLLFGASCAAFLRTVLPAVAVLYIAFTFCFGAALYKQMPLPQSVTLTVSKTFVRNEVTSEEFKIDAAQSNGEAVCQLVFVVYNLNENLVFPLPNVWYKLCGTNVDMENYSQPFAISNSDSGIKKFFYGVYKKILGESRLCNIEVPVQQVYPSLFNLKMETEGADFNATLERIM